MKHARASRRSPQSIKKNYAHQFAPRKRDIIKGKPLSDVTLCHEIRAVFRHRAGGSTVAISRDEVSYEYRTLANGTPFLNRGIACLGQG
jgi:hypothetical protein